ncbi:MAG: SLBB domain-containing protein [Gammaproteobacteria bacterium]|nr:SLBB domain-containing protein [Gammaproteobacteria bacterium]
MGHEQAQGSAMRVTVSSRGLLAGLLLSALCLCLASERAQGQATPTPDQLQTFQGLTPDQQQAIRNALGTGGQAGNALETGSRRMGESGQPDQQEQLRRERQRSAEGEEGTETLIPVLKSEDWVVIEIDYQLAPRRIPPYLQALYSAPAQGLGSAGALAQAATQAGAPGANAAPNPNGQNADGSPITAFEAQLSEVDRARLDALMALIRSRNPYRLSRDGALSLPGFPPIALLGLTEEQATLRLKVEPAFRGIDVRLTRLPIKRTGTEQLKPFGYDLFDEGISTFAPVTNVPVPSSYVVGPGDQLNVQLYGNQNRSLQLTVARDGTIHLPEIGPVPVGGQSFEQLKSGIEARVARQMIGTHASVSMGDTRSIQVFVLGEAKYPGSYTVSGLATITSALYAARGAKVAGSLRNIQLKRNGALVRELDLYDLLIRGDTTDDAKLLPGDVIFIPAVGPTASIEGEVRRPAIYEIKSESSVADLLQLAGGLTPEADVSDVMVTRIDASQHRIVVPIDVSVAAGKEPVRNGDLVRVMRLRPTLDSGIVVQGHLYTPGTFAYRQGIRLSDVIRSVDELRPDADIHYLLIRRELPPDRRISVLSADLAAALKAPGSPADVELSPRDRVTVFDLASGRDHVIQPLLDELRVQGTAGQPTETVYVEGQVKVPGEYPLEPGMRVSDLIRAGGGAADAAYAGQAELARYSVATGARRTDLIEVDLAAAMRGDAAADVPLRAFDRLTVKEVPLWGAQESVTIKGEVRFPGSYVIRRGETLKSVIERAGGLTAYAFPQGSVFTRDSLRIREQEQLDRLAEQMQRSITSFALGGAVAAGQTGGAATLGLAQSLMVELRQSHAVGRMVIDLPRLLKEPAGSVADVLLRDGDQLAIPRFEQQVTVIGEVNDATSHLYNPHLSRDDYVAQSGGTTRRADASGIYVVRANGSVVAGSKGGWFRRSGSADIEPGDTIVVPLNVEHLPPLPLWTAVTTILYNVAIAVAAVHSL